MNNKYNPNCGSWYAYASWTNTKTILEEIKNIDCKEINITINNLIIICNTMMTKLEEMEKVLTREDVEYLQEQTLRANLEVKNHDIKIVRMLEEMQGISTPTILSEENEIVPVADTVYEVKKNLFGKEKVVKVK